MAEVVLPDGNVAKVPDFALEKTQNDMKQLLSALVGADEKALKIYENIFKNAKEQAKQSKDDAKELQSLTKDGNKALEEVADAAKKGKIFTGENVLKGIDKIDGWLTKSFLGLGGAAITAAGFLASGVKGLGDELLGLQEAGVGFTDVSGSAEKLVADLGYLGMSAGQASNLMADFSGAVQSVGKTGFAEIQKTFANLSNNGNDFGLSIAESAELLAEDLQLRTQLGIMETLDNQKQAQATAELRKSQMKSAQLLGKSISEIANAGKKFVVDSAQAQLSIRALAQQFPGMGTELMAAFQRTAGELEGMGIGPNIANSMMTAFTDVNAFISQGGQELFTALQATGAGGAEIAGEMDAIQKMLASGDKATVEAGMKRMEQFPNKFGEFASALSPEELNSLKTNLAGNVSPALEELVLSLGNATTATENRAKAESGVQSGLARGAQAFDASMNTLTGSLSGMSTDLFAAFGEPMKGFADAFTKDGEDSISVMSAFKDAMEIVRETVMDSFGIVGESTDGLAEKIRQYLVPAIQGFADWFKGGGFDKIKNAFNAFKEGLIGVTQPFRFLYNLLTLDFSGAIDNVTGAFDSIPAAIGAVLGGLMLFNKALRVGSAAKSGVGKVTSFFGGGGGGAAAAGGGGGKAMGAAVSGVPQGAGGLLSGLASGLTAMGGAAPVILLGAATLAGVIAILAGGVAVSMLAIGAAMPTFAEGLEAFNEIDGLNLIGVGAGLTALGAGMMALAAGSVAGLVGGLADGITSFFGGSTPFDKVEEFSKLNIDAAKVKENASAVVAYGKAMAALGAGGALGALGAIGGMVADGLGGFFDAEPPIEKLKKFAAMDIDAEKVKNNAEAVAAYGKAMAMLAMSEAAAGLGNIGSIVSGLTSGIAGFFGGTPPVDKLAAFGQMDLNVEKIKNNAEAVSAFGEAMAALAMSEAAGGLGSLGNLASSLFDGITSFFGGSTGLPVDKMNEFGAAQLNRDGIIANAETVKAFGEAMGGLSAINELEDIEDILNEDFYESLNSIKLLDVAGIDTEAMTAVAGGITQLASAYLKLSELDAEQLVAVSKAIGKANTTLSQAPPQVMSIIEQEVVATTARSTESTGTANTPTPPLAAAGNNAETTEKTQDTNLTALLGALVANSNKTNKLLSDIKDNQD